MCLCKQNTWVRTFEETQDGKYPPSEHAPGCNEYVQEEFTRLTHGGTACVMETHEAQRILAESDEQHTVCAVLLTRDQFERLADFAGF